MLALLLLAVLQLQLQPQLQLQLALGQPVAVKTKTHYDKTDGELIHMHRHHVHVLFGHPAPYHNIRTPFATTYRLCRGMVGPPGEHVEVSKVPPEESKGVQQKEHTGNSVRVTMKADAFMARSPPPRDTGYTGQAAAHLHLQHHQKLNQQQGELSVSAAHALLAGDRRAVGRWERGRGGATGGVVVEARVFVGGVEVWRGEGCGLSAVASLLSRL